MRYILAVPKIFITINQNRRHRDLIKTVFVDKIKKVSWLSNKIEMVT